ncbi:hypothetical protein Dimus_001963 [Dionaea muscipula]
MLSCGFTRRVLPFQMLHCPKVWMFESVGFLLGGASARFSFQSFEMLWGEKVFATYVECYSSHYLLVYLEKLNWQSRLCLNLLFGSNVARVHVITLLLFSMSHDRCGKAHLPFLYYLFIICAVSCHKCNTFAFGWRDWRY